MSLSDNSVVSPQIVQPTQAPANGTPVSGDSSSLFKVSGAKSPSPLDFIKGNLREPVAQAVIPPVITEPKKEAVSVEPVIAPEVKVEVVPELAKELTPEEEFPDIDPKNPVEVNFKKLRTNYKLEKEEHKKAKEALTLREQELEDYKTGKKLPDTLQNQEAEITRLKGFEKIVSLKTSPEYQEKFVTPLNEVTGKLEQLFTDYDIPKEVLAEARTLKSAAQVNRFLSENFDSTGALEVKALLDSERKIVTDMQAAEKEPLTALQKLQEEGNQARVARVKQEREVIQHTFRDSWVGALTDIKEEGKHLGLIQRPGDTQYNEGVVNRIVGSAATEAGKLLSMLVEDGLTKLRPEVGKMIAKLMLVAHESALNAQAVDKALGHVKELEQNTTRMNNIVRPPIGGSTGANPGITPAPERMTPQSMAKALADKITAPK